MQAYKDFTFPLNAYAHVLTKEYGNFEYLHYGLFEPGEHDVIKAQQRASDLLFSHIPPRPCRILEVGIGLGTTLNKLVKAGYDVTGITPDGNQINYAKKIHGPDLPAFEKRLEDFSSERKFDLLIFQESAQYIDTTSLFNKAVELLNDGGQILIMDEVALRPPATAEPGLPLRETYLSLAKSMGFEVMDQLDLSAQAAPTNGRILDAVTRHSEDLIAHLGLPKEHIEGLVGATHLHIAKYGDARYGYCLLKFKKSGPSWFGQLAQTVKRAMHRGQGAPGT